MTQHTRTLRLTRELGTLEPMLKKVARGSQTLIRGQDVFGILEKRTRKKRRKKKKKREHKQASSKTLWP